MAHNRRKTMARFNHMFDIAFSVETEHENWEDVPTAVLINALEERVRFLKATPTEAPEAFGYCDTYEIEEV
jgi:hypothetical protein